LAVPGILVALLNVAVLLTLVIFFVPAVTDMLGALHRELPEELRARQALGLPAPGDPGRAAVIPALRTRLGLPTATPPPVAQM
jgi:hypothetical protein